MNKLIMILIALTLACAVPTVASATGNTFPDGPGEGAVDPAGDPPPIGGQDGGTCDWDEQVWACVDAGVAEPCEQWGWECAGDEGTGEICYIGPYIIPCRDVSAYQDGDGNPNHDFVEGPPAEDHWAETTIINCWESPDVPECQ
jgi:hypothetical protein